MMQANDKNQYTVTAADLPLSCPMPGMTLWNSHPKVYLPIDQTGGRNAPIAARSTRLAETAQ